MKNGEKKHFSKVDLDQKASDWVEMELVGFISLA